jgi:hypothetical protein
VGTFGRPIRRPALISKRIENFQHVKRESSGGLSIGPNVSQGLLQFLGRHPVDGRACQRDRRHFAAAPLTYRRNRAAAGAGCVQRPDM